MALLAGACSAAGHHSSAPTTTAITQAAPNPDVIPAVITPAYVNAVFVVLNRIYGEATRSLYAADSVSSVVSTDLRSIFNDPLFAQEITNARESLPAPPDLIRPPGDIVTTVVDLLSSSSTCIFVSTRSNFTAVVRDPGTPAASEYWVLRRKQSGADPDHLNPTPWALSFNADYTTPTTIPNQCPGG